MFFNKHKYHARSVKIDGIRFSSLKEAARYRHLQILLQKGEISDLKLQPKFLLQDKFKHAGKTERAIYYVADFAYVKQGKKIVEDVKGFKTEAYGLKRKMFLAKYGGEHEFLEIS